MASKNRLRQPAYTGQNRCIPCTIANIVLAAFGSAVIAIISTMLGVAAFVVSIGVIYLRGYLVPGTPTLTKQYAPDRILRWFDKEPIPVSINEAGKSIRIDPEQVLINAHTVTPCQNGTDLCLRSDFRTSWRERQHTIQNQNTDNKNVLDVLDLAPVTTSVEEYGGALVVMTDDEVISRWPSSAAVTVDVAAAIELAERYPEWDQLNPTERARVLASLRIFAEECPECGGSVEVNQELVESCCRSYDVLISSCQSCDAQLFEIEWQDEFDSTSSSDQPIQSTRTEA